ncbi:MAG: tRNA (N(6)-L-threonylcarbamoyladenosine(37)-C(2))-methylthiotransferase MtaB [Actinobacteria bacterium]|nr:tRNA (N(6)-L-threonylcarbamoyladenosine(37)-C(2))-methylthiotransferase MtaB [Actinomycetota bacterium]
MNNLKFSIYTLGCKTNQSESDCITNDLISRNFQIVSLNEKPDFAIINTCTVTSASDSKARQLIRRMKQSNPEVKIIVTGCFVVFNEKFLAENKIEFIVRNEDKYNIPELVCKIFDMDLTSKAGEAGRVNKVFIPEMGTHGEVQSIISPPLPFRNIHSRALVKIQDGCEQNCSYCVVPSVRGSYKSIQPDLIINTIKNLVSKGFEEIVITGIHIGKYGIDFGQNFGLPGLIKKMLDLTAIKRIRLSSIEVNEINRELIEIVRESNCRIAWHFHIPLQSGSNRILKLMNRNYNKEYFLDTIKSIKKNLCGIAITTDIIVGFPGESEADFMETLEMARNVGFSKMHIFKFSPRINTPAALMEGQISETAKSNRSHIARKLGEELRNRYIRENLNDELEVLCEEMDPESGLYSGTSGNYIKVYFTIKPDQLSAVSAETGADLSIKNKQGHILEEVRGKLLKIKVKELYRGGLMGKP